MHRTKSRPLFFLHYIWRYVLIWNKDLLLTVLADERSCFSAVLSGPCVYIWQLVQNTISRDVWFINRPASEWGPAVVGPSERIFEQADEHQSSPWHQHLDQPLLIRVPHADQIRVFLSAERLRLAPVLELIHKHVLLKGVVLSCDNTPHCMFTTAKLDYWKSSKQTKSGLDLG